MTDPSHKNRATGRRPAPPNEYRKHFPMRLRAKYHAKLKEFGRAHWIEALLDMGLSAEDWAKLIRLGPRWLKPRLDRARDLIDQELPPGQEVEATATESQQTTERVKP